MNAAIVGAGVGGLCTAIGLAARGVDVHVFEQGETAGGKLGHWSEDGFAFDMGPHVLTMPWAFDDALAPAKTRLQDIVELVRLDEICRYWTAPEVAPLVLPADPDAAASAIRARFRGEERGFARLLRHSRAITDATTEPFLRSDFSQSIVGAPTREQWNQLWQFAKLQPWLSLRTVVQRYIHDPQLRQIFEIYALYSGSHPARTPGIIATVADIQWREGLFYISGGMHRLARALQALAESLGTTFHFNQAVSEIRVEAGIARGITANTKFWPADHVVCAVDALRAFETLLPNQDFSTEMGMAPVPRHLSTSAFVLLLGVEGEYPELGHHNCFLSEDPEAEYADIFDRRTLTAFPTIGVACQSVTDPTRAPAGHTNLFVMTNPPAISRDMSWEREVPRYRELILDRLEYLGLRNLRQRIRVERILTPNDLEVRTGAFHGAIYGFASNGARRAFFRPPNQPKTIRKLHFVGGTTHPGGGMPLCALSGARVSALICSEAQSGE